LCNLWRAQLERPNTPGEYTKLAIVPQMDAWLAHDSGSMSFHITQLMTGHGCFNRFLWRIGKRDSAACDFCDVGEDDATHTLKFCSMWNMQRERLREKLGLNADFSLGEIVDPIIVGKEAWTAFSAFAEDVMCKKEEEERRRGMVRDSPPFSSFHRSGMTCQRDGTLTCATYDICIHYKHSRIIYLYSFIYSFIHLFTHFHLFSPSLMHAFVGSFMHFMYLPNHKLIILHVIPLLPIPIILICARERVRVNSPR